MQTSRLSLSLTALAVLSLNGPVSAAVFFPPDGRTPSLLPDGVPLELVRADEFDGARLDADWWDDFVPTFLGRTTGFLFARDNVSVSNGCLRLTARNLRDDEKTVENLSRGYDKYATAIVRTRRKFRYGYFEARARGMRASVCNAFWLYDPLSDRLNAKRRPGSYSEEVDIFEFFGAPVIREGNERTYFTTVHRLVTPYVEATVAGRQTKLPNKTKSTKVDFDFWADFHTYGFLWTPAAMKWYVDGREVFSRTNDQFHAALHLTLDCEIMQGWAGDPPPETLPQTFEIDHVRVFGLSGAEVPPEPVCRPALQHVTAGNLDRFAWTNLKFLRSPVRGIAVFHHALGWTPALTPPDGWQRALAEKGVVCLQPFTGPWCWENDRAVALTDRLVSLVKEKYNLPAGVPVVSAGSSSGGQGALVWPCYSRHRVSAILANCPVCDLADHAAQRPDVLRTVADAVADAGDLDFALRQHSPIDLVDCLPEVPVLIVQATADEVVDRGKQADRYVQALRTAGRAVEYAASEGQGHCGLTPEARAAWNRQLEAAFGL